MGKEQSVIKGGMLPTGIPTLPTIKNEAICGNVVTVGSVEQISYRFNIPHKNYSVIIKGQHSSAIRMPYVQNYGLTQVLEDDWNFIVEKHGNHPSFKNNRIFVEKSQEQVIKRANDSEVQEISKLTGTARLNESDLASSTQSQEDNVYGTGVSDVEVKVNKQ